MVDFHNFTSKLFTMSNEMLHNQYGKVIEPLSGDTNFTVVNQCEICVTRKWVNHFPVLIMQHFIGHGEKFRGEVVKIHHLSIFLEFG